MRIAFVIPWFGRDLKGGAEQQAWQIASRLAGRNHDVEVLTTCCRSHQDDWATNHLPAGRVSEPEGFAVHRFPVDPRNRDQFDRVCSQLLSTPADVLVPGSSPVPTADGEIFADDLIKSTALLDFLRAGKNGYDWFLLMPYLYGPVLRGIEIVADRAALQPCLHDEAYAYLPQVADAFRHARRILFNSEGERELALRLFGPAIWEKSIVVGEGVEPEPASAAAIPADAQYGRFVLYLGRKDTGKNVDLLRATCLCDSAPCARTAICACSLPAMASLISTPQRPEPSTSASFQKSRSRHCSRTASRSRSRAGMRVSRAL